MSETITFQSVLDHLLDSKKEIPHSHLQHYSDLDPKSLRLFLDVWPSVKPNRKLLLLEELLSHLNSEVLVSYEEIGMALLNDADGEVRARAIGLLAESNDPELVDTLIDIFLNDADLAPRMESANLLDDVVSKLLEEDPRIRLTAAEAAGELSIEEAGPIMLQMLEDEEEDDDVISAAIWSLSQIGGDDARIYLVHLIEQTEDEDLVAFREDALENMDFNEELDKFDLLSL
ncbi:MAG: HEAT repeat domain-containing protein, partial [Anaerolineales bacterium]|nr:HEAT repeat domain-containing protein [Anaerolineales bacterium]